MKKALIYGVCLLLILCSAVVPAFAAVDYDYEGILDAETDEPVRDNENSVSNRVEVGNAVYDKSSKSFIYNVSGAEVTMNYPSGIVTTSTVSVNVPDGTEATLYRDGVDMTDKADLAAVKDVGKYVVLFTSDSSASLEFTIVGTETGIINGYAMPAGFSVTSVTLNGENVSVKTSAYVDMIEEGDYVIKYRCADANVSYTLAVEVDHTAPTLLLEAVKDGYADGPVDISDLEDDCTVKITHDGTAYKYQKILSESGKYEITVQDKAGNKTDYQFVIRIYFNFNSVLFILLLIAVIAAIVVYIVISRRKLRTR